MIESERPPGKGRQTSKPAPSTVWVDGTTVSTGRATVVVDVGASDTGQDEWVFDSHSRHELVNLLACATIPLLLYAPRRHRSSAVCWTRRWGRVGRTAGEVEVFARAPGAGARGSPRARSSPEPAHGPEPEHGAEMAGRPRPPPHVCTACGRPSPACPASRSPRSSIGFAAAWFASAHDLTMLYADARSHLTIARRLVDGPNHNIVQLGTVWLPLPHLALLPLVVVARCCGTRASPRSRSTSRASSSRRCRSSRSRTTLTRSKRVAWLAVRAAPHEPVDPLPAHDRADRAGAVRRAARAPWRCSLGGRAPTKPYSGGEIALYCGLPAAAMVLVALRRLGVRRRGHRLRPRGRAVALAPVALLAPHRPLLRHAVPCIAAAWWMWFNWVNLGDPLEFQRGQYSAQAQQELLAKAGLLPDKGNLVGSLDTLLTTVVRAGGHRARGRPQSSAWCCGSTDRAGRRPRSHPGCWSRCRSASTCFSLFTGQIVIRLDNTRLESMFNMRYGVETLPGPRRVRRARRVGRRAGRAPRRASAARGSRVLVGRGARARRRPGSRSGRPVGAPSPVVAEGLRQRAAKPGEDKAARWMADHAARRHDPDRRLRQPACSR